jgi:hypothetical protein
MHIHKVCRIFLPYLTQYKTSLVDLLDQYSKAIYVQTAGDKTATPRYFSLKIPNRVKRFIDLRSFHHGGFPFAGCRYCGLRTLKVAVLPSDISASIFLHPVHQQQDERPDSSSRRPEF